MKRVVHTRGAFAAILVAAVVSTNCGSNSVSDTSASNPLAPSQFSDALAARKPGGGKPGGGGTTGGSGSLAVRMVTDNNANGLPNWGDRVTFDISTTATTQPHVGLKCSQNGVIVYSAASGFYPEYPWPGTEIMTLSSVAWTGGSASCTATLYYISGTSTVNLTTLTFTTGA